MIKFKQTARMGGDETAPYDVIFDQQYTVREFIDYVLPAGSGAISLFRASHIASIVVLFFYRLFRMNIWRLV